MQGLAGGAAEHSRRAPPEQSRGQSHLPPERCCSGQQERGSSLKRAHSPPPLSCFRANMCSSSQCTLRRNPCLQLSRAQPSPLSSSANPPHSPQPPSPLPPCCVQPPAGSSIRATGACQLWLAAPTPSPSTCAAPRRVAGITAQVHGQHRTAQLQAGIAPARCAPASPITLGGAGAPLLPFMAALPAAGPPSHCRAAPAGPAPPVRAWPSLLASSITSPTACPSPALQACPSGMSVALTSVTGATTYASAKLRDVSGSSWRKYTVELSGATATDHQAALAVGTECRAFVGVLQLLLFPTSLFTAALPGAVSQGQDARSFEPCWLAKQPALMRVGRAQLQAAGLQVPSTAGRASAPNGV